MWRLLEAKNTQKGMKELIYWIKCLIRVVQQPQKPLSGSNQIWATTSDFCQQIFSTYLLMHIFFDWNCVYMSKKSHQKWGTFLPKFFFAQIFSTNLRSECSALLLMLTTHQMIPQNNNLEFNFLIKAWLENLGRKVAMCVLIAKSSNDRVEIKQYW